MKIVMVGAAGLALAVLSGCSVKGPDEQPDATSTSATENPVPAPAAPAASKGRIIPVSAQGVAEVGLTVRVKGVELGSDATILDISASYGGTNSGDVDLAFSPTFIKDEQGNKLMLKRIPGNEDLKIRAGEQMDGRLVFLGAVLPSAKTITLVLNEGNDGSAITGPGLTIPIDLKAGAQ
jgi:predicted small lipoprotein YifL